MYAVTPYIRLSRIRSNLKIGQASAEEDVELQLYHPSQVRNIIEVRNKVIHLAHCFLGVWEIQTEISDPSPSLRKFPKVYLFIYFLSP